MQTTGSTTKGNDVYTTKKVHEPLQEIPIAKITRNLDVQTKVPPNRKGRSRRESIAAPISVSLQQCGTVWRSIKEPGCSPISNVVHT